MDVILFNFNRYFLKMNTESFERRHIGPTENEIKQMLSVINANSIDELIDQTIPKSIRNDKPMRIDPPISESDYLTHLKKISSLNKSILSKSIKSL